MVGKLIELENAKAIIKPVCFHIKPLKDIIDFYPETYDRVIHFLHCRVSLNPNDNPFADVPEEEKEEVILRALDLDIDTTSDIIKEGLEAVYTSYSTPLFRSYESLKYMRDRINLKLKNTEIDFEKDGNSANITSVIKSLGVFTKEMKEAKKAYLEEQGEIRGRGGVEMAYDENDEDDDEKYIEDFIEEDEDLEDDD